MNATADWPNPIDGNIINDAVNLSQGYGADQYNAQPKARVNQENGRTETCLDNIRMCSQDVQERENNYGSGYGDYGY